MSPLHSHFRKDKPAKTQWEVMRVEEGDVEWMAGLSGGGPSSSAPGSLSMSLGKAGKCLLAWRAEMEGMDAGSELYTVQKQVDAAA